MTLPIFDDRDLDVIFFDYALDSNGNANERQLEYSAVKTLVDPRVNRARSSFLESLVEPRNYKLPKIDFEKDFVAIKSLGPYHAIASGVLPMGRAADLMRSTFFLRAVDQWFLESVNAKFGKMKDLDRPYIALSDTGWMDASSHSVELGATPLTRTQPFNDGFDKVMSEKFWQQSFHIASNKRFLGNGFNEEDVATNATISVRNAINEPKKIEPRKELTWQMANSYGVCNIYTRFAFLDWYNFEKNSTEKCKALPVVGGLGSNEECPKSPDPVLDCIDIELASIIRNSLKQLGEDDFELLRLRYTEALTIEDIGSRFGLAKSSISKKIERAINKLKEIVRQREI